MVAFVCLSTEKAVSGIYDLTIIKTHSFQKAPFRALKKLEE